MLHLSCEISDQLQSMLDERARLTGSDLQQIVNDALRKGLKGTSHTLFQISTSTALVDGVYQQAMPSTQLLSFGDFGVGTFERLDGEMVVLDGEIFQIREDGRVRRIADETGTPFAMVVPFAADTDQTLATAESLKDVLQFCDKHRDSPNLFYAIRIDGEFEHIRTRAMKPALEGLRLAIAAKTQSEFEWHNIAGTLVGLWSPSFSKFLDVPGYHFHFLSQDRQNGGHLLACSGRNLRVQMERLTTLHLALPDSARFLHADLTSDPTEDLASAEAEQKPSKGIA